MVWNLGTTFSQHAMKRMLVSGIFKQLRIFVEYEYEEQIFDDRESFILQRKCAMSALVEIIFFRAWPTNFGVGK